MRRGRLHSPIIIRAFLFISGFFRARAVFSALSRPFYGCAHDGEREGVRMDPTGVLSCAAGGFFFFIFFCRFADGRGFGYHAQLVERGKASDEFLYD